jgi:hypothetical protein
VAVEADLLVVQIGPVGRLVECGECLLQALGVFQTRQLLFGVLSTCLVYTQHQEIKVDAQEGAVMSPLDDRLVPALV